MADLKDRITTPAGNFHFDVKILAPGASEEDIILELPAIAVRGLGDGRTNVIRHRPNAFSAATRTPFPGLSVPDGPLTIDGHWLYDMGDIKKLQLWRDQVKGNADVGITGIYRDILVLPVIKNESYGLLHSDGAFRFKNCLAVKLSISDQDVNAPAISNWSLEVEFEDMIATGSKEL